MDEGTELGHYRVVGAIGEGGMGQVFRAEDTRLRREVALKLLPAEVADDPERLARLEREAQLLARLEHPNVAAVYGLEEAGTTRFLVMQLIEGRSLSERIAEGALSVDSAVPLALQIAEGLEAAHERGIIHRDLKPANIMVTPDGGVRILDFGLAKASGPDARAGDRSPDLTASPTMMAPTQVGVLMGTAAYMSPEQARGGSVDKRTDVWAFGCVLYEMLTGSPAFGGETVTDILAGIVHRQPELQCLPPETPWRVRHLLERCLDKDPVRRLRDIGEARIALERVLREPDDADPATPVAGGTSDMPRWVVPALLITALVATLVTWGLTANTIPETESDVRRFVLADTTTLNVFDRIPGLSRDGRRVVFHDGEGLAVRDLSALEPLRLPDTEEATFPFWSPAGHHVGYVSGGRLWRSPVSGGEAVPITSVGELEGAWWRPDDIIVFADDAGLWRVAARGGDAEHIFDIDDLQVADVNDLHYPSVLPDDAGVLFRVHSETWLGAIGLWDGERGRVLLEPGATDIRLDHPIYAPSGHLLYTRAGSTNPGVWAVRFDLESLELRGEPFLLYAGATLGGIGDDGSMMLIDGLLELSLELVWVGRDGTPGEVFGSELLPLAAPHPRIAPTGDRLAVQRSGDLGTDVWVLDVRGGWLRVTADPGDEGEPAWHPSDGRLAYTRDREAEAEIWIRDPSSDDPARKITEGAEPSFSPDGETLVFSRRSEGDTGWDLWMLDLAEGGEPRQLVATPHHERQPVVSPDGRWLAYASDESGEREIYVQAYPEGGTRRVVSTASGVSPRWGPSGDELYYQEPGTGLMAVAVASPEFGVPEVALAPTMPGLSAVIVGAAVGYDVDPAGGRLLVVRQAGGDAAMRILLVQNWKADLATDR